MEEYSGEKNTVGGIKGLDERKRGGDLGFGEDGIRNSRYLPPLVFSCLSLRRFLSVRSSRLLTVII